jgi:MFS transporter, ACS family, DAL5 transporter family protein
VSYFIPTITVTLGYTATQAQYMTIPIYVCLLSLLLSDPADVFSQIVAAVVLNIVAWNSDRILERRWHTATMLGVGFIAATVCATVTHSVVRYTMMCLIAAGIVSPLIP